MSFAVCYRLFHRSSLIRVHPVGLHLWVLVALIGLHYKRSARIHIRPAVARVEVPLRRPPKDPLEQFAGQFHVFAGRFGIGVALSIRGPLVCIEGQIHASATLQVELVVSLVNMGEEPF